MIWQPGEHLPVEVPRLLRIGLLIFMCAGAVLVALSYLLGGSSDLF